jgi:phenylpropionate dioxygenase-like ring-hydroxylating dioxygenase large terminal subunit
MTKEISSLPGISEAEISLVNKPLEEAWTMPVAAYTSEEIYTKEVRQIMRRNWLPVARVDQVANPGDFLSMTLFDQPVMIVRGTDNEVRVMSRVCLHRAAPIVEGAGNRKLFSCPYHAWSYGTDGQLIRAPLMEGAEGFSEKECRLPQIRTEIWNGFIMVNFDNDAPAFAPQVSSYTDYFENFKLSELVVARTIEFDSGWNWKVLVENFMEAYHHIAIHAETFEPIYHAKDSKIPDADGPWSILHMPTDHEPDAGGLPMVPGLEEWQQRDLFATAIFPHFLLGIQGNATAWYQVLPESADRMLLKIHMCFPASTMELPNIDELADGAVEMISYIHNEDIVANDMVWDGLTAPMTGQGRLSPLERSIWQFNQWWISQMTDASSS